MDTFNFDGVEIPIVGYGVMGLDEHGEAVLEQFEANQKEQAEARGAELSSATVAPIVNIVTEGS